MTGTHHIAVLGARGAVGAAAVRRLHADGHVLRLGGRQVEPLRLVVESELGGRGEARFADAEDPAASLLGFCDGCDIVLNCAGPSHVIMDRVATAAHAAGADYVDAAGDDPLVERLDDHDVASRGLRAVASAGMMPGLSGLLPRALAAGVDRSVKLAGYVGGLDIFTRGAAEDYVRSVTDGYGEALAAWRSGRRAPRTLEPLRDVELPFFPGRVTAYPYLSTEGERIARDLQLFDADWYNVFAGEFVLSALGRVTQAVSEGAFSMAAEELSRAASLDVVGRDSYQLMLFELDGEQDGEPVRRTAVLRATDAYELSGAVAALAVMAVVRGDVPAGVHYAAELLDPRPALVALGEDPAVTFLHVVTGRGPTPAVAEEVGEI